MPVDAGLYAQFRQPAISESTGLLGALIQRNDEQKRQQAMQDQLAKENERKDTEDAQRNIKFGQEQEDRMAQQKKSQDILHAQHFVESLAPVIANPTNENIELARIRAQKANVPQEYIEQHITPLLATQNMDERKAISGQQVIGAKTWLEEQTKHNEKLAEIEANKQARLEQARLLAGLKSGAQGAPKLNPTLEKEVFQADELANAAQNTISMLQGAKELNKQPTYSGYGATARAQLVNNMPSALGGQSQEASNTVQLNNMMTGQALESLKATFGGNPTEGERAILLELQASADKTPQDREKIINRAIDLANQRLKFNANKSEQIKSGKYFQSGNNPLPNPMVVNPNAANNAPQRNQPQITPDDAQAIAWARANPRDSRSAQILSLHGQ